MAQQGSSTGVPYWIRRRIFQRELALSDFSGGLNLRDAPTELANNESPELMNVTLDERGGIQKRLGFAKKNPAPYATTSPPQNLFEWKAKGIVFTQCGADIFKDDGTASVHTWSTTARCGFAEFGANVYAIHPADGIYTSTDGVTWTAVVGSPKGFAIEPWQNRLLALGDPVNGARLYASAIGDAGDWTLGTGHGWYNDIREHDSEPLIALAASSGVDITGKPGLIVCKHRSSYRVNDPDTGAYETLDTTTGAASPLAVITSLEKIFVINANGVYETNGVSPFTLVSGKLQRLFQRSQIAFDQATLFCAGAKGDRVHFSLPKAGATANNLHLEYHPVQGWFVMGTDAASCYTTFTDDTEKLYAGSPAVAGQVYEMGTGGSDDGADITCSYQVKWLAPMGGVEARFRRVRVFGRGVVDVAVLIDFDTGSGETTELVLSGGGLVWDGSDWDITEWPPTKYEDYQDVWSLGMGTHISFRFSETSSALGVSAPLFADIAAPEVGAFALYGIDLQFIPIGV